MAEYKDYYGILGVAREAGEKEIKSAFRRLARQFHPDVNPGDAGAEERFKEINEAYEVLSDPEKRAEYDSLGAGTGPEGNWRQSGSTSSFTTGGPLGFTFNDLMGMWGSGWVSQQPADIGPFHVNQSRGHRQHIETQETREPKVDSVLLPNCIRGLIRAIYRVQRKEEDSLVVVSITREGRSDSPKWRVSREGDQIKIEASTALLEGEYSLMNELSREFQWVEVDSQNCSRIFGIEFPQYIQRVRNFVINFQAVKESSRDLNEFTRLAEVVARKVHSNVSSCSLDGIEKLYMGSDSGADNYIYRENDRLVIHEDDLGLLLSFIVSLDRQLPREETVLVITKYIPALGDVPQWVFRIEDNVIVETKLAKGNPLYEYKREKRNAFSLAKYVESIIEIANEIHRKGVFTSRAREELIRLSQMFFEQREGQLGLQASTIVVRDRGEAVRMKLRGLYNNSVGREVKETSVSFHLIEAEGRAFGIGRPMQPEQRMHEAIKAGNLDHLRREKKLTIVRPDRIDERDIPRGIETGY